MFKVSKYIALFFIITFMSKTIIGKDILDLQYGKNMEFPWELTENFLHSLKKLFNIDSFIETGTWKGYTARNAASIFSHVGTVELSKEIYDQAKDYLKDQKNITCYLGNSNNLLESMIKDAHGRILFWLDGHYSGGSTALGNSTTPIIEELRIIKKLGLTDSVILIDDIRYFDQAAKKSSITDINGYPLLEEIVPIILDINQNYEIVILGDILLAFEKRDSIEISNVLKAYTHFRMNQNIPLKELIEVESRISQAKNNELITITNCYNFFCKTVPISYAYEYFGVAAHYALCYSLTLVRKNQKEEALKILNGPINLALNAHYLTELKQRIINNKI